jgi:serine O-acetyltransferase
MTRPGQKAVRHEPFFASAAADVRRNADLRGRTGFWGRVVTLLGSRGLWALVPYRFGRSLRTRPIPLLQPVLWVAYRIWEQKALLFTSSHLDVDATIGPGLYVDDWENVWVGRGAVIGSDCGICQMACVLPGPGGAAPVIGDRVFLGAAAKVVGGVRIGDGASIAAGAWVAEDVPAGAIVVGNPARPARHQ